MALQALVRWLLPREDYFYDWLDQIAALSHTAAVALEKLREKPASEVVGEVQKIEHQADDVVRAMEDALARTFVTPLDREDLHRLTSEIDDIVDLSNLTARVFNLYHIEKPTEPMVRLMTKLVEVTAMLKEAVPRLRKHEYSAIVEACRKIRQAEKDADAIYRAAISDLFAANHIDFRELLKQKEALDDLEHAVDHCDNVADLLSNLAVKHG